MVAGKLWAGKTIVAAELVKLVVCGIIAESGFDVILPVQSGNKMNFGG